MKTKRLLFDNALADYYIFIRMQRCQFWQRIRTSEFSIRVLCSLNKDRSYVGEFFFTGNTILKARWIPRIAVEP